MSFLYKEDFEGMYLRANNFKGTNPFNTDKIAEYRDIVKFYASKAYRFNKHLFFRVGLEQEDVEAIGSSYVYTFFINNKSVFNDAHHESSILQMYLRQRYENLIIFINRKVKGIVETSNYENFNASNKTGEEDRDIMEIFSADDAMTAEQILVSECTKKEFKDKILRYIDTVYGATFNKYKGILSELKISETEYRKVCLFYIVAHLKTVKRFQNTSLKSKDIRGIRLLIYNFLTRNSGEKRMQRIRKVLNSEIDIEA